MKDETYTGLASRAMLVKQTIGAWTGRKVDRKTSRGVTKSANAQTDAGAWWTRLVPPAALRKIAAEVQKARKAHYRFTLPWSDEGPRVLPAAAYFDYTSAMRACRASFEEAVKEFIAEYPTLVTAAPARLGQLLPAGAFPDAKTLKAKFYFETNILPLPTAGDFRAELGEEAMAEIRADIEKQGRAATEGAMRDVWGRLYETVSRIAEKLGDPEAVFHKSLLEKAGELCDLLPKLNVTGDPDLERMRQEVAAKLAGNNPETMRTDKPARAVAAAEAARIAAAMEEFFKPAAD